MKEIIFVLKKNQELDKILIEVSFTRFFSIRVKIAMRHQKTYDTISSFVNGYFIQLFIFVNVRVQLYNSKSYFQSLKYLYMYYRS